MDLKCFECNKNESDYILIIETTVKGISDRGGLFHNHVFREFFCESCVERGLNKVNERSQVD